jgi:hypothetical protein
MLTVLTFEHEHGEHGHYRQDVETLLRAVVAWWMDWTPCSPCSPLSMSKVSMVITTMASGGDCSHARHDTTHPVRVGLDRL